MLDMPSAPFAEGDELAIRNLVARCADAVSRRDVETFESTWAENGTWDLGRVTAHGRAEVVSVLKSAFDRYAWMVQIMASGEVAQNAAGAQGVWYVIELQQAADDEVRLLVGRYHDTYVRESGTWVLLARKFQVSYRGEMGPGQVTTLMAALAAGT
jgi:hypothetical protein